MIGLDTMLPEAVTAWFADPNTPRAHARGRGTVAHARRCRRRVARLRNLS